MKHILAPSIFSIIAVPLVPTVSATVLTFDITGIADFQSINQGYGDNVTSTTVGTFSYGGAEGFTPNVSVEYGDTDPALWTTGYGNLTNVLFENADSTGILTMSFVADPGFEVVLHEFDLAAFGGSDLTIDSIDISNSVNSLFNDSNVLISAASSTNVTFAPTLQAQNLIIAIDARNLGALNDNIGIDNIVFSQVAIPEPSSSLLLSFAFLACTWRRSRR